VKPPAVFAGRLPRLLACLSLADWGVVALTLVLDLSLLMPWVSLAGYVIRPIDLHGAWALVGLLALIVVGYRKIAECFVAGAVPAPPTTPVRWGASPEV
jgi:hypothetical protein